MRELSRRDVEACLDLVLAAAGERNAGIEIEL